MKMNFLGLIPARGGSKGIPNKNLYPVNGKPLIAHTIEAAKRSKLLTKVVVSTDSEEIAEVSKRYAAEVPFFRPKEISVDKSTAKEVMDHALAFYKEQGVDFDFLVYLQPTSPLRTAEDIDAATLMMVSSDADSLVSVVDVPHQFGIESLMIEENGYVKPLVENAELRRQDKVNYVARNGPAIVITRPAILENSNSIYGESVLSCKMPPHKSVDIDQIEDIEYIEWLISQNDRSNQD